MQTTLLVDTRNKSKIQQTNLPLSELLLELELELLEEDLSYRMKLYISIYRTIIN